MASAPARVPSAVAIKSILFPIDFSASAGVAAEIVRDLAIRYGATVHFTHVLPPPDLHDPCAESWDKQFARARLETFASEYQLSGLRHSMSIEVGDVSEIVDAMVQQLDIDLMVVGTHGRTGVSKVVLGSVAEKLFRSAPCPVLTVGPHVARHHRDPINSVLLAIDFSESADNALRYASMFAQESKAELVILHAMDEVGLAICGHAEEMARRTRMKIDRWARERQMTTSRVTPVAKFGHAGDVICRTAAERHCGLVVMGARATAHVRGPSHSLGATAYHVVCAAHCPVLTTKSWTRN